jgi:hypothetical protein
MEDPMRKACILVAVLAALIAGSGCSNNASNASDDQLRKDFTTKVAPPQSFLDSAKKASAGPGIAPPTPPAPKAP